VCISVYGRACSQRSYNNPSTDQTSLSFSDSISTCTGHTTPAHVYTYTVIRVGLILHRLGHSFIRPLRSRSLMSSRTATIAASAKRPLLPPSHISSLTLPPPLIRSVLPSSQPAQYHLAAQRQSIDTARSSRPSSPRIPDSPKQHPGTPLSNHLVYRHNMSSSSTEDQIPQIILDTRKQRRASRENRSSPARRSRPRTWSRTRARASRSRPTGRG
jgi:hypothetical protein